MENMELTWKDRYDRMKKHYGWTNQNIANLTGKTKNTVDALTTNSSRDFPGWLKLAIIVFETENPANP